MSSVAHIRRQDLELVKKIGEGGYGSVYLMIWKTETGDNIHVAAKKQYEVERRELEVLSKLSHPNIVSLIGVVPEEINFMLILELCEGGSLRSYLDTNERNPLPKELFKMWSKQAAKAIQYLNHMKIVHKDIKCDNYLITGSNILKLADFGLAKELEKTLSNATQAGSWAYMAPELLKDSKLSPKLDIFAFGVVLWEMLTGQIPYDGMAHHAIVWHVCHHNKRLEIPSGCPRHLAELMALCWQEDHQKRPSIDKVLSILDTKKCGVGTWVLERQFAHQDGPDTHKLHQACGITVCASGDIGVYDIHTAQVNVYDNTGKFTVSLGSNKTPEGEKYFHKSPRGVAAGSGGRYFLTDESQYVKIYDSNGELKDRFTAFSPQNEPCSEGTWMAGLALDNNGELLVGACKNTNFISRHTQSGEHISTISIDVLPVYLAVTPLDTIIISSWAPNEVQIVEKTGQLLHRLTLPTCVTRWRPTGVCCSEDTIFIANDNQSATDEYGIYCYSLSGDYLGCATKEVINPTGIAVTEDGSKLLVAQYDLGNPQGGLGLHGVKIFCRKD